MQARRTTVHVHVDRKGKAFQCPRPCRDGTVPPQTLSLGLGRCKDYGSTHGTPDDDSSRREGRINDSLYVRRREGPLNR